MSHDHDHGHGHNDNHDHEHGSELSEMQLRVRALETILTEKGYVDPAALDSIIETYETKIGPHIGAQVVAKAWADPAFREALLADASKAIAQLGLQQKVGDHLIAVENTPATHNMIVCTLCSCYPWDLLGLPPAWYKSAPYRARTVKEPRRVLADFGVTLPDETKVRVWDSTAETRFIVLPMRPAATDGWSEEQLASLVTRDSMIGTGLPKAANEVAP
ncbi:nitrile hydratase subunit alpha [Reyranella sp.]|uniref:nitrile hydratase subunit alpha n=1 Tax=Reyranella sp. TaxID=1929291 RepID=UPI003C7DA357